LNTETFSAFYVENKRGNFYMTKNILAIAIAAAVAAPSAFAAATVYGVAHMSVNSFSSVSDGATAPSSTGLTSISSNTSLLGVKGSEDLGGGMKAVYQMEFGVALDGNTDSTTYNAASGNTTTATNSATTFTSQRNTFVGLSGGFGTVLTGRHDSLIKLAGRKYDLFGDQVGNNRNILRMSLPGVSSNADAITTFTNDGRHNNVLAYISPTWSGFHFGVAYVPSSATSGAETYDNATSKTGALTALADYTVGSFSVTAGYINIDKGTSALKDTAATPAYLGLTDAYTAYRLGAGYTFGAAKVVGLYQNASAGAAGSQDTYGLGGSYKVGAAGTIKAQYYMAGNNSKTADSNGTLTTVGYDHALSKNTTAYAVYSAAHNAANAGYTTDMGNAGAGSNVAAITGKDNSAVSVGLIHNF
jgi:predicted porin